MTYEIKPIFNLPTRAFVLLEEGEQAPATDLIGSRERPEKPPSGYRWETDAEFTRRCRTWFDERKAWVR